GLIAGPASAFHEPAGSPARGLAPDLAGWKGGSGRSVSTRPASPGATNPAAPDRRSPAIALDDEAAAGRGFSGADIDAWEAIRRMRTAVPLSGPVAGCSSDGPSGWSRPSSSSPGGREASFQAGGGASGSVIERLLREQNEMIRQDAQRAASPPISAPPPFRGGGLRMGS
ncbi:MAG: hypothetical protein ACYC61_30745, partial [Isosphaeraceae bacterium]